MHRLWCNGQWALPITTHGFPSCLFNEQGEGVDFEHQAQLSFWLFLVGRIKKGERIELLYFFSRRIGRPCCSEKINKSKRSYLVRNQLCSIFNPGEQEWKAA